MSDEPAVTAKPKRKRKSYSIEKVVNFRNIALFATALSILFQGSYLSAISPVLLSYMSLQDTIFKTALMLPVLGVILGTIINFIEDFEARLDSGAGYYGSEAQITVKGFCYLSAILIFIIFAYSSYKVFVTEELISEQLVWLKVIGVLVALPFFAFMLSYYLWQLAVVRHDAETQGLITSRNLTNLIFYGIFAALILGSVSGLMKRGTPCKVTIGEAVQEAHFFVSLSHITVLKILDEIVILNSSDVDQMICG